MKFKVVQDNRPKHLICRVTGKRGYSSARTAKNACAGTGNRIRAYPCKFCRSWHVTAAVTRKRREEDDWN